MFIHVTEHLHFLNIKLTGSQAVEIAIRSQLDNTGDQLAAFVTVEKLLADSKSVKDYWILELYDWAYSRVHKNYSQTVGALRAGFVKDVWKPDSDKAVAAARSFYACAINNDWENAQKVK